jgi:cell volume regulation protein A
MSNTIFILAGLIITLGFLGNYLFKKKGIPDNLLLISFGIILGPVFHLLEPSGFRNIAPIFSNLALLIILFDGGMSLNLYKVMEESPKAMILGVINFFLSMVLTTAFTSIVLKWGLLHGLLLGAIIGGTSSSIVLPLARKMDIPERVITLLSLESVFTDAIVIVVSITLLDLITEVKAATLIVVAQSIVSSFSIGIVLGLVCGVIWIKILSVMKIESYDDILTLSLTILFYGVTELVSGNGAIFSLVFGLVMGNAYEIGGIFRMDGIVEIGGIMRKFMSQMSFFIRTYFFVYLGLILFIEKRVTILYSIAISLLLLFGRYLATFLTSFKDSELSKHSTLITSMLPRGLAAAIMAQLVASSHISNASMYPDVILIIIITTVIISSIASSIIHREDKLNK